MIKIDFPREYAGVQKKEQVQPKLEGPKVYEVHISDMRTFKTCRQRWDYSSLLRRGWSHEAPQKHLWLGSTIHDALEMFYTPGDGYRDPEVLFETYESIVAEDFDAFERQPLTAEQWKELDDFATLGRGMLEFYARWSARNDLFEVIVPEVSLKVPIPDIAGKTVVYAGRADGLVKMEGDFYLLEHKTASRLPDMSTLFLDEQCVAYQWGCQIDPRFKDTRPIGTIYNFLVKKVAKQPRVLKSGALSKSKSQATTYELYMDAIAEGGYDEDDYADILAHFMQPENAAEYIYRTIIRRTPQAVATFSARFVATIAEMLDPEVVIYPNPSWWSCKYCPFRTPCSLEASGIDPDPLLRSEFKKREPHRSRLQRRREEQRAKENCSVDTECSSTVQL